MKKSLYGFLAFILFTGFLNQVNAINVSTVGSPTSYCPGASVSRQYYIPNNSNSITKFQGDLFWSSDARAISDLQTNVNIWEAQSGLISCTNSSNWVRISSFSPGNYHPVIATGANCTFNKPTDPTKRTVQIVYKIGYFQIVSGTGNYNMVYYSTLADLANNTPTVTPMNNIGFTNFQQHPDECMNIELRYCGDGIYDPGNGEICDPNDPNHSGWGTGGCNNSCQPVDNPVSCDSLTMNPLSGNAPLSSTATCSGTNATSYSINCGNGQIINAATGVCTYPTAGNFTATCTVNGSITSTACQKTVTAIPVPEITIDKRDANANDRDGNVGNDTQSVGTGEKAVFKIKVTNTGTDNLTSLVLTDPVAPNCGGAVTLPGTYPATWSLFVQSGAGDHTNNVLEPGEAFEYTCEKLNTTVDYTNTADVCGTGVISGTNVCDTDPTVVKVGPIFDLALTKKIQGNTTTFAVGAAVTFVISIFNQGDIAATNTIITDYIPTGLTLNDGAWTQAGNLATINAGSIAVGASKDVTITFIVNSSATGNIINWAEISSDSDDDIDSTPDQNNENDCHGGLPRTQIDPLLDNTTNGKGDANNNGVCNPNEDEDDHDPALISIGGPPGPAITIDKRDANPDDRDGIIGTNDSQTVLRGSKAVFKIKVTNSGNEDLQNLVITDAIAPACAGALTLPSTFPATWSAFLITGAGNHTDAILQIGESFEYTCEHPNTQSNYTNTARVDATGVTSGTPVNDDDPTVVIRHTGGGSSSSSSGGSSNPTCYKIETDRKSGEGNTLEVHVTCSGNSKAKKFRIDCGNGQEIVGDMNTSTYKGTGICSYSSNVKVTNNQKCYVGAAGSSTIDISSTACRTSVTLGGSSFCGDGVVQRPNSNGEMEQCERAKNADGSLGNFPDICTAQCRIRSTIPGECSANACVITIPNDGIISFGPFDDVIIGNNMNPFDEAAQYPIIRNDSGYDLYFDELCVMKKSGNTLTGTTPQCKAIGEFFPGEKVVIADANFRGAIANIPNGQSYGDNELITTIKHEGQMYDWAYFAAHMKVRVSKPSVATTGGGTSYLGKSDQLADITKVADGVEFVDKDKNKNFVGTSVSDNLSSYTKDNVDESIKDKVEGEGQGFEDGLSDISYVTTGVGNVTSLTAVTTKYNGIDNVFILKGQNLHLSAPIIPASITGPRTYIIEDGDLIIDDDFTYDDNIAFVVKGGNIILENDLKEIEGTFIAIPKATVGGNIMGKSSSGESKTLIVRGSLYGKIDDLLNKRTYVSSNEDGQITVGTIVSFASGLFRKPAPLVSQFIEEYLASEKVAK